MPHPQEARLASRRTFRLTRGIAWLRGVLGTLAGASLFGMMTLTFMDVIGRKLLNQSIVGSVEITELLMLTLIFTALPLVSLGGAHVLFDLLDSVLPERLRHWQSTIANYLCALLMAGSGWIVLNRALRTAAMADITPQLAIPLAPFHFAAAALLMACAAAHLYLAVSGRYKA
jgi:TRAP-type C4-dicarboxylate transport system permease small subunit